MDALDSGRIPAFYREFYEFLCPSGERIDRDTFMNLLQTPYISTDLLKQIWDSVERCTGYITRDGFYKALALVALSAKSKEVNERILDDWGNKDLPVPDIGTISDIRAKYQKMVISRDPLRLSQSFNDICQIDSITLDIADRKGVFFKHQEYKITSQRYGTTVYRRYSDFDAFRDYLIQRFPYRLIPALPPKSAILSSTKMERRKKELCNFLMIVSRHPAMCDDSLVRAFLVYQGPDVLTHYKTEVERIPDEFMTNEIAPKVKSIVHGNLVEFLSSSNVILRDVSRRVSRIVDILRSMVSRLRDYSTEMKDLATEFRALSNLQPATHMNSGIWKNDSEANQSGWPELTRCLNCITDPSTAIIGKSQQQALACEEGVLSVFEVFLALLEGYVSLLQRLDKGVAAKHKQAITKMATYKKRQISATTSTRSHNQDDAALRNLEQRIIEQDKELSNQENRIQFSQFCQLHEIQLVYKHVELVQFALLNLVKVNAIGHSEIAEVWLQIQPSIEKIVSNVSSSRINNNNKS